MTPSLCREIRTGFTLPTSRFTPLCYRKVWLIRDSSPSGRPVNLKVVSLALKRSLLASKSSKQAWPKMRSTSLSPNLSTKEKTTWSLIVTSNILLSQVLRSSSRSSHTRGCCSLIGSHSSTLRWNVTLHLSITSMLSMIQRKRATCPSTTSQRWMKHQASTLTAKTYTEYLTWSTVKRTVRSD